LGGNHHTNKQEFDREMTRKSSIKQVFGLTLPEGWAAYSCPKSNRTYFQNNAFQTTQWERPISEIPPEAWDNLQNGWEPLIDLRVGKVYYQNNKEFRTQWEKPSRKVTPNLKLTKSELAFIDTFNTPGEEMRKDESLLFENGECAVCFESLFENGPTVLIFKTKRVCRHFICKECAHDLVSEKDFKCPLCRAEFRDIKILPDIRKNPKDWFYTCDTDSSGYLCREELQDALTAILPIQHA